ncbi:MAG TPA: RidA family protein [Vicinamibacterales bacterium]|nr:RidA family protein [Vicinamibacterales bacterium]
MRLSALLLVVSLAACAAPPQAPAPAAEPANPEFINLVEPWPYPFSSAVKSGNLLFLSGQIGTAVVDGAPALVSGGFDAEARQTLENIKSIVEGAGSSMDRVVKCTVMLADMADWPRFNEIYTEYFPGPKPARAAFGANGLALGARVEVDCIAMAR